MVLAFTRTFAMARPWHGDHKCMIHQRRTYRRLSLNRLGDAQLCARRALRQDSPEGYLDCPLSIERGDSWSSSDAKLPNQLTLQLHGLTERSPIP